MRIRNFTVLFWALATLLVACAHSRPDLGRLYAGQAESVNRPPVILIPGALGSRLADAQTGREVWPGSIRRLLLADYSELALQIDPDTLAPRPGHLIVSGLTDRAAGRDFYSAILRVLEHAGGYRQGIPGEAPSPDRNHYYVFAYDWRQDNVDNVRRLDALIEQLRIDYGDPGLRVDIIAHSMGGLIARYYGRYGTEDVLDDNEFPVSNRGAERMRRVVLLGTPNLGAVGAMQTLKEGYPIGLARIPPEVVATFPSTYQVMPHPLNTWLVTTDGRRLDRDHFSSFFWRRFQMSVLDPQVRKRIVQQAGSEADAEALLATYEAWFDKRIERARRFVWSLTVPEPEPAVRFIVFGGNCNLTPARIVVEEFRGDSVLRFHPDDVRGRRPRVDYERLMLEPGDGVVTKPSLLARQALDPTVARHHYIDFPLDYAFFLCERHNRLTGNVHFQDNLLHALLSVDGDEIGLAPSAASQ
jgi:pimeloyl-ACP methyl ester carboxylesterase